MDPINVSTVLANGAVTLSISGAAAFGFWRFLKGAQRDTTLALIKDHAVSKADYAALVQDVVEVKKFAGQFQLIQAKQDQLAETVKEAIQTIEKQDVRNEERMERMEDRMYARIDEQTKTINGAMLRLAGSKP